MTKGVSIALKFANKFTYRQRLVSSENMHMNTYHLEKTKKNL